MNSHHTYKCTVVTPLGSEQFYMSLPYANNVIDISGSGRIWNEKGEMAYSGLLQYIDHVGMSISTDVPIPINLRVTASPSADMKQVRGRISIEEYGFVDYDGVLSNE
jgi:hypothetical protein